MKIERLTKDNIEDFIRDLSINDENLQNEINKVEYYGIKKDDKFYISFNVLPEDDRILITYINKRLSNVDFLSFVNFLNNSLVVKSHLIIQICEDKYMKILDEIYRCKDICMAIVSNDISYDDNLKEKYAEIDMHNIKYFYTKNKIVCNLLKQNIQDEEVINKLHLYFQSLDVNNISFIIPLGLYEFLSSLGYKCAYKSYVIEEN